MKCLALRAHSAPPSFCLATIFSGGAGGWRGNNSHARDWIEFAVVVDRRPARTLVRWSGRAALCVRAAGAGRTLAVTAISTPGYSAAEQMTPARQGPWTDIYGVAATMYQRVSLVSCEPAGG